MPDDRGSPAAAESGVDGGMGLLDGVARACREVDRTALGQAIGLLDSVQRKRARVYILGNGGSAATASHMACDLAKTVSDDWEKGVRAIGLSDNSPLITAWTNDVGPSSNFAGQLAVLLDPDDVVMAISVSGNSPNILAGLKTARDMGATIIGLLGGDGGAALLMVDIALHVPYDDYGIVETVHLGLAHALVAGLRARRGHPAPVVQRAAELTRVWDC
jgi:D-sedoheptulose 7-phosphate isomerase